MQRFRIVVYIIIGCFFVSTNTYAFKQPVITVEVNKSSPVVGGVFKLQIKIAAEKSTKISWDSCDQLFKGSGNYILLTVNNFPYSDGYFKHEILFTSIKAVHSPIKDLPILIDSQKYAVPPFLIEFKADKAPTKINEIKPIAVTNWGLPLKAALFCILLILILFGLSAFLYFILVIWIKKSAPTALQRNSLSKLSELELKIENDNINTVLLIDEVIALLTEYLIDVNNYSSQQTGADKKVEAKIKFTNVLDRADELKFLPLPAMRLLYPDFIHNIRHIITNYQPKTIR